MKNVWTALILSTALYVPASFTSSVKEEVTESPQAAAQPAFKGNWTESFTLKNGEQLIHTPNHMKMGYLTCGQKMNINGNLNGFNITNLYLETNSTRDEFVAALKRSNLY